MDSIVLTAFASQSDLTKCSIVFKHAGCVSHQRRIPTTQVSIKTILTFESTGEIHHQNLFNHIDALGYTGWIGCEYKPKDATPGGTDRGLAWIAAHGQTL